MQAQTGGFTAAGEDLHMAQSTVSAHLARLEEQTGCRLLEREHNKAMPTEDGERLLAHARRMLRQNALAWEDLRETPIEGSIRLGIEDEGLPSLPAVEIAVHFSSGRPSNAVQELHTSLGNKLGNVY